MDIIFLWQFKRWYSFNIFCIKYIVILRINCDLVFVCIRKKIVFFPCQISSFLYIIAYERIVFNIPRYTIYAAAAFFFCIICSAAEIPTRTIPTMSVTVPGMIRQRPPTMDKSLSITFRFANM